MDGARPWTCPTCGVVVETPYCATCGEQPLRPRHLSLADLAHQFLTAVSKVDGQLLRSLRWLVLRPGALTVAYVEGRRRLVIGPLPLFLITNALFFFLQSASHSDIFSSPLDSHLHHQDWSGLAQTLVARRLEEKGTGLAAYAPLFDQAARLHAKSLIILMVFMFAGLLPAVFFRKPRPLAAHVVFSLHLYAFLLLLFCADLTIVAANRLAGGAGLEWAAMDQALSVLNLAVCIAYLRLAIGRVYGARGALGLVQATGLAVAVAALVLAYRFAIFLITLYST